MSIKANARKNRRNNFRTKVLAWANEGFKGNIIVLA